MSILSGKSRARIVLSFDDGRKDNLRAVKEVLLPRGLKATFNITTGYVDGSIGEEHLPCDNPPLSIDDVVELHQYGLFEIAGHGHEHSNTMEDWKKGLEILKGWLGQKWSEEGIGIASPHSVMSKERIDRLYKQLNNEGIRYVRVGLENQRGFCQRAVSKIARETTSKRLFYWPIQGSLKPIGNSICVYSVPVLHKHTVEQLIYTLEKVIEQKTDCVLMLHSIVKRGEPYYDSMWSWDYNKFEKLCDFLVAAVEQRKIEVITNLEAFIRMKQE